MPVYKLVQTLLYVFVQVATFERMEDPADIPALPGGWWLGVIATADIAAGPRPLRAKCFSVQ